MGRVARVSRTASFWLAAGVTLLVSHDAVFLVQVGPGKALADALTDAGHGHAYWANASVLLLAGGTVVAALWFVRMAILWRADGGLPRAVPEEKRGGDARSPTGFGSSCWSLSRSRFRRASSTRSPMVISSALAR